MDRIANIINSSDNKVTTEIFVGIAICVAIYLVLYIIRMAMNKVSSSAEDSPILLDGLVNAKYSRNVKQNPNEQYAKTLKRSMNENGIEYSYSLWLYIDGETWHSLPATDSTVWKHIFHKGPKIETFGSSDPKDLSPIQCPGLWLHPSNNVMRLYVNSYNDTNEYVEISNLPVKKWIHFVYTQSNFVSNIYINGRLKSTHTLLTLPRQNYYDLYMTENGGFHGYLSSFQYFNYVLAPSQIYDLAKAGPSLKENSQGHQQTETLTHMVNNQPYLSNRWWVEDITMN